MSRSVSSNTMIGSFSFFLHACKLGFWLRNFQTGSFFVQQILTRTGFSNQGSFCQSQRLWLSSARPIPCPRPRQSSGLSSTQSHELKPGHQTLPDKHSPGQGSTWQHVPYIFNPQRSSESLLVWHLTEELPYLHEKTLPGTSSSW